MCRIAKALLEKGIDPILDEWEFIPGKSLTKSMDEGIKVASAFILFWSKHSALSGNVGYEREIGLMETKKRDDFRVICILLDDTPPPTEHSFRLCIDWRQGKCRSKSFSKNIDQLSRAISGLPLEKRPEIEMHPVNHEGSEMLRFVYASDFSALNNARNILEGKLESEPKQSPAGPYFKAKVNPHIEAKLRSLESVWVYSKQRHESEEPIRKYIYIEQVEDVDKFQEIVGNIEDAPNWEATNRGLYLEADVVPDQINAIELLPSVSIFDEPQHILTDQDKRVHELLQWSKRASNLATSEPNYDSVELFAAAVTKEFQNICLVELDLSDIDVSAGEHHYSIQLTMSHATNAKPQLGQASENLDKMIKSMTAFVGSESHVNENQIEYDINPVMSTDGLIIMINYSW